MPDQTIHSNERQPRIPGFDAEATPLLGLGLGLTGLALGLRPRLAAVPLVLTALAALFYRDPNRATPAEPATVFAAADGTLQSVEELYEHRFLHTDAVRLVTAVSPLHVPVTRSPANGVVRYLERASGEFRPAWDAEAAERNERNYIGIETIWGPLLVVQIAGPLARRIACRVQVGDNVAAGERIGTVRFGARIDLILPRDAVTLLTSTGQALTGGISRIGH
ncbi:MAG: phosphatidylserine decarboxylase, partial [Chloroflexales bacterium]|nr:phosphatidylserine decarboxylase [Chloroflexales bacterium]